MRLADINGQENLTSAAPVAIWVKSSHSMTNGNCVEVAVVSPGRVWIRDSKSPSGSMLTFTPIQWHAFVEGVRSRDFDVIEY
jgi:hypothetical protein